MMMQSFDEERNFIRVSLHLEKPIKNIKILFRQGDKIIFQEVPFRDINFCGNIVEVNLNYCFQTQQFLRIENHDNQQINDSLIIIGDIIGKQNYKGRFYDHTKQETGSFDVKITPLYSNVIKWQWKGKKLLNTDGIFGKSDPFLRFLRLENGEQWILAHQTEVIKDNLNPIWDPFEIELHNLNNGYSKRIIKIECWDHSKKENHHFIGNCLITLEELQQKKDLKLKLINNQIKSKCGYLEVKTIEILERQSIISHIQQGYQIKMMIGIDFTKSNDNQESLHHLKIGKNNEYIDVIQGLASILIQYSRDEQLEAFGFGGIPKFKSLHESNTNHCFPMTGEQNQYQIKTLNHFYQLYQHAQKDVELSSPTLFAPFLQHYYLRILEQNDPLVYNVLFVITDGDLHDFEESNKIINDFSKLPISIIFVGVGDKQSFLIRKLKCEARNLVQYVKFQDFNYDPHKMTQVLLKEFLDQFLHYFAQKMTK